MHQQSAQFFPKEERVLSEIARIAKTYALPCKDPWGELAGIFDAITLEDSKKEGYFWLTLGNINYRISLLLPGICTGCTPDLDFDAFSKLAAQEEDIITVKWNGKKNTVLAGYLTGQNLAVISGIPYPEKERHTAKVNCSKSLDFAFAACESRTTLSFQEDELEVQRISKDGICLSRLELLSSLIQDDYSLEVTLPPMNILHSKPMIIAPSEEGVYFAQPELRIYAAGKEIDPPENSIPIVDADNIIDVSEIRYENGDKQANGLVLEQSDNVLRITGSEIITIQAPKMVARNQTRVHGEDLKKLLHCSEDESEVKLYQYPSGSLLVAVETSEASAIHLLLLKN